MNNRIIVSFFFLSTLFSCTNSEEQGQSAPLSLSEDPLSELPNIVYILADDLGYGDIKALNAHSKINTPHIDKLVESGMLFTDAHAPSAVCTPTRYGILTGRYCWRSRLPRGVLRGYGRALLDPDRTTVASLLQSANYHTGVVGKWHLGLDWVIKEGHEHVLKQKDQASNEVDMIQDMDPEYIDFTQPPTDGPLKHGFDYSYILPASLDMEPYCYLENDKLVVLPSEHTPGNDLNTGYTEAFWRAGKIAPGFKFEEVLPTFTQKAQDYIKKRAENKEKFFLYFPLAAPHTPWVPTSDFAKSSQAGTYGDFVQQVDATVGNIMATLEANKLSNNTLIIFTSDNGPFWRANYIDRFQHRAAGHLRGMKADIYEGGHRIPFIAKWPGVIPAASKYGETISLTDLIATCAEMIKRPLKRDEGEDSFSLWPILTGEHKGPIRETTIHHSSKAFFAIRQGDWKLIQGLGSGGFTEPVVITPKKGEAPSQLYHLENDIGEKNNVYLQHPEIVERMSGKLEEIKQQGRSRGLYNVQ